MYEKIMFIETAVKNITVESILKNANSESIQEMYNKVVCGYNNAPTSYNSSQRKKAQQNKLKLQNIIQSSLSRAYDSDNPKITHFYNKPNYSDVPIWALFEILSMGNLGFYYLV